MPPISRRHLARGTVALLSSPAITLLPSAHASASDERLIALCREYMALQDVQRPLRLTMSGKDEAAGDRAYDYCDRVIWPQEDVVTSAILGMKASGSGAIWSKAAVAESVLRQAVADTPTKKFDACADLHEKMAMSLILDILN